MDVNDYVLGALTNERLDELRAQARAAALLAEGRRPRPPLRVAVGGLLVRLGNRLLAGGAPARATA
jgi:hypothetical protein